MRVVEKGGFEMGKVWLVKKDVMHRVRILNLRVLLLSFGVLLEGQRRLVGISWTRGNGMTRLRL